MYYERKNTDKKISLLRDVIIENNPLFKNNIKSAIMEHPKAFNYTYLIEETLALCSDGKYEFIDDAHCDFSDDSECKTGTLYKTKTVSLAEITNVRSKNGTLKKGAIRCVVINPEEDKVHYIFFPTSSVYKMMHTKEGIPKKSNALKVSYSKKDGFKSTLEKYGAFECKSFKELATQINS